MVAGNREGRGSGGINEVGLALRRRPAEFTFNADQPVRRNPVIVTELQTAERAARIGRAPANRREHVLSSAERATEIGADIGAVPIVGDRGRGCGLGVEAGQDTGSLLRGPELLRYAEVVSAARAVLRRKHADAGAVADLVDIVGDIDHIEPDRNRQSVPAMVKLMRDAGIDLPIRWEMVSGGGGHAWIRGVCPQAGAIDEGCARGGAV